eukprot:Gb_35430 [translate_table: standard]
MQTMKSARVLEETPLLHPELIPLLHLARFGLRLAVETSYLAGCREEECLVLSWRGWRLWLRCKRRLVSTGSTQGFATLFVGGSGVGHSLSIFCGLLPSFVAFLATSSSRAAIAALEVYFGWWPFVGAPSPLHVFCPILSAHAFAMIYTFVDAMD